MAAKPRAQHKAVAAVPGANDAGAGKVLKDVARYHLLGDDARGEPSQMPQEAEEGAKRSVAKGPAQTPRALAA